MTGISFIILTYIFQNLFEQVKREFNSYVQKDLKMQEKRKMTKNTHNIICPKCGASNLLTSQK